MLARVKEAGIATTMRGSNVRVLDAAKVPALPYRPDRVQLSLLGLLAGVFVGGIVLTAREQTNRAIQSPGDLQAFLDLPELGVVPRSPGPEPFRSIAASLRLHFPDGGARVLAITSAHHAEGRSTITARLAKALADTGKRVLALDADLRFSRLHQLFSLPNETGLAELLAVAAPISPAEITRVIRQTSHPRIELLTTGDAGEHSPDLLYSPRLEEILTCARKIFDIVLIDTPPMLHNSDARVIGRAAGSVVLVARAGKTTRDDALRVGQKLAEDRTPMVGSILNDWKESSRANRLRIRPDVPAGRPLANQTSA
jgi:capsular exopolysaccharide synthesis family protein